RARARDCLDVSYVTIHRKQRLAHHEPASTVRACRERLLECSNIAMRHHDDLRAGQPTPIHDARVVELVTEDNISCAEKSTEHAHVRCVPGVEQTNTRTPHPVREVSCEIDKRAMVSGNQP